MMFLNYFALDFEIKNTTKTDNGVEYRVNVTNKLGEYSATTRLNVTCNSHIINL
jgi:hypothetical protein